MRRLLITAVAVILVSWSAPEASAQTPAGATLKLLPAPPFPAGTFVEQVACPQALTCVAVGFTPSQNGPGTSELVTLHGRSWQKASFPVPPAKVFGVDFACPAAGDCEVIVNGAVWQWDMGEQWTPQVLAPTGFASFGLQGVACADAASCVVAGNGATGAGNDTPFIEGWDGQAWSFVSLTRPRRGGDLFDIACATKTMCMAVGSEQHPNAQDVGFSSSIAYRSTVHGWNLSNAPDTKDAIFGQLTSVACPSVHTCIAPSTFTNGDDQGQAQADVWHDGHWRLTPLPGIPAASIGQGDSGIGSPACMSATSCIAVGSWTTSPPPITPAR